MPAVKTDRLVLDTNVIISAFLKRDFDLFVDFKYLYHSTLFTCPEQIIELERVLKTVKVKKNLVEPANFYIDFFKDFSILQVIDKRFDRSADPDDNYLFDLAYTVKAYYLVTGEKALLNMKQVNKIRLITLNDLMAILKKRE